MIPRGVLDIDARELWFAARCSFVASKSIDGIEHAIQRHWDGGERAGMVCLSVRSGLDAVLHAVDWPAGSEVLMSAVTIPEMARIVSEHGFVPVPIDVHARTLSPDAEQLRSRITPRSRALLVAHLFGSRLDLSGVADAARDHGLELWEDVAQGFAADGFPGDAHADISFFSFGMIKAQTALGAAYLRFRNAEFAELCRNVVSKWPQQAPRVFREKTRRAAMLQVLSRRSVFTIVAQAAGLLQMNLDERLSNSVRGFSTTEFFEQLRQRPCNAQLQLLHHRLVHRDRRWMAQKTSLAEHYRNLLPGHVVVGGDASFPSHWVLPIRSHDPQRLRAALGRSGYDATVRGSQLRVIPPPVHRPDWLAPEASNWVPQLLYLPLHPALRDGDLQAVAQIVSDLEGGLAACRRAVDRATVASALQ